MKVGLALGSGGARGFAHLGVIEVLERAGIPIDLIVGSSAGAAIGSMYAFRPRIAPSLTHIRHYLHSELYDTTKLSYLRQNEESRRNFYDKMKIRFAQGAVFASSMTRSALFTEDVLRKNVQFIIPPVNIEEGLLQLAVVAFDINSGAEILITEGPLVEAVMASCAIPGVFPPVQKDELLLMDGGILNPVPCDHARALGADVVIGVDLSPRPDALPPLGTSYEVAMRAADITRYKLKNLLVRDADTLIPVDVSDVFWADFSQFDRCVEAGRQAAERALPAIREAIGAKAGRPELALVDSHPAPARPRCAEARGGSDAVDP